MEGGRLVITKDTTLKICLIIKAPLRKLVGKYAGGQKHGVWRAYNNRGEQVEMIHYKHGEVFKINGFRVKEIDPEE